MDKYLAYEVETPRIINDLFLFGNGLLYIIVPPMSGESLRFLGTTGGVRKSSLRERLFFVDGGELKRPHKSKKQNFPESF